MSQSSLPPGPRGTRLGGNLAEFRRGRLAFFESLAKEYGDVAAFRLGPKRIYLVTHPDLIERILVTDNRGYRKHFALRLNPHLFGKGLLTNEGDSWLRQRRLIQPVFARSRIAGYANEMVRSTQQFLATWRDGETRDVTNDMARLTLGITAKVMFGAVVQEEADEVRQALHNLMTNFTARFGTVLLIPNWIPTLRNLSTRRAVRQLDRIIYRYIERGRRDASERNDLLSLLLRVTDEDDGSRMDDKQVRDEAITLFLAGHETTALGLAWTWHLLSQHPEIEERVVGEALDVIGERPAVAEDVPRLPYLNNVIRESMRIRPPVYTIGREALQDHQLGGYGVPKGTTVLMPQWVVQRDPRFFDEPEAFRPERWTEEFSSRLHKLAYFPFGGGPRLCIGNHFGLMEMTLILATIAQRFRFTCATPEPVVPQATFTLRPCPSILTEVTARAAALVG